jgi:seryl-tRNA synthetase/acyl carrier protein
MLTREELENRLLEFVRRELVQAPAAHTVSAETRLFEERLVDSLKVLDLIAFLESATGRKIPDAQVVLANFRSVAAMASVFSTNGDRTRIPARRERVRISRGGASATRIFERSHAGRHYSTPDALLAGAATSTEDGSIELHGSALALAEYLDARVADCARELGAVEEVFADTIAISTLETAGFVEAFPQKLVRLDGDDAYALPPAVCYHHYPHLANQTIEAHGSLVTARGACFREEHDHEHPLERLRAFTMREIVAAGSADFVEGIRADLIRRVSSWLVELDLDGFIESANDPFFTSETRGRMLMQQLQPLKYELRLAVGDAGRTVAAASFNNHRNHFGRAFSIRQRSGKYAHSGCIAFGWERWVLAFFAQHGADDEHWPLQLRRQSAAAL